MKIIILILLPITFGFSQTKSELLGLWLLDSNSELLNITTDSITFNSGFFEEGKQDTSTNEINFLDIIINYEITDGKMILKLNKEKSEISLESNIGFPIKDTLVQIDSLKSQDISSIWISNKNTKQMLLILSCDGSIKLGAILKSVTMSYTIETEYLIFTENTGDTKFRYQIENNVLKLFPNGSTETFIYKKI